MWGPQWPPEGGHYRWGPWWGGRPRGWEAGRTGPTTRVGGCPTLPHTPTHSPRTRARVPRPRTHARRHRGPLIARAGHNGPGRLPGDRRSRAGWVRSRGRGHRRDTKPASRYREQRSSRTVDSKSDPPGPRAGLKAGGRARRPLANRPGDGSGRPRGFDPPHGGGRPAGVTLPCGYGISNL